MSPVCLAFPVFSHGSLRPWWDVDLKLFGGLKSWGSHCLRDQLAPSCSPMQISLILRGGFLTQGILQEGIAHTWKWTKSWVCRQQGENDISAPLGLTLAPRASQHQDQSSESGLVCTVSLGQNLGSVPSFPWGTFFQPQDGYDFSFILSLWDYIEIPELRAAL